jgi:Lysylphosphatidylglycerol synthase TM region
MTELALDAAPTAGGVVWRRKRVVGGIAVCVLSVIACVLLARRLTGTSWPLEGAHVPLAFAAAGAYLLSFGFRGAGWHQLFPRSERPGRARCMAACGASAATGVVLPFRLDYVVKIATLRGLSGVRVGLGTIGLSILALGLVDAVAMLPLAISALATSSALVRPPLIVVVVFCLTCLAILALGTRTVHLPLVHRSRRLQSLFNRVAETTRLSRSTVTAGLLLFGCWTSRAAGSTLLLCALGVRFSPTLALVVLCLSAAASILPITAGGAVAGIGATAGVLVLLGVPKDSAVNFSLASGLLLTSAALAAAALGLAGSLVLVLRRRRTGTLRAVEAL